MTRLILVICLVATWFIPSAGEAQLLCQHRKSKRIILADECPSKFHPIYDLSPMTELAGQISALQSEIAELRQLATGAGSIAPPPAIDAGSPSRIVTADLDLSTVDGNGVGVAGEEGNNWIRSVLFDATSATAFFMIDPTIFEENPRCIAGLADSSSPDSVRGLEVQVGWIDTNQWIGVRVTGQGRQLDVWATLICMGPTKP